METKFTKAMDTFNRILNKLEKGSEDYRFLCRLKYKFIQEY
jgi:hypothetical protein